MRKSTDFVSVSDVKSTVVIVIAVVFFAIVVAAILLGAYFLSVHAIDVNNATQHALSLREQQSQLRSAVPTCRALGQLSNDAMSILKLIPHGAKVAPSIISFFHDFPQVFKASNCVEVLKFASKEHI